MLEFDPSAAQRRDALMGWAGGGDTLGQVRMNFATAEEAVAFAEKHGLAYRVVAPRTRRVRTSRVSAAAGFGGLRKWLPALLPLALLLAVAIRANRDVAADDLHAFPITRAPLQAVQEAYAARRVRNGIESYRFVEGRWPRRLGELEHLGLLDGRGLASTQGRLYYYEQRDGRVLLLAPER